MPTQTSNPQTATNDASTMGAAWSNPARATFLCDTIYTTVSLSGLGTTTSQALKSTDLGFSIPSGATINGIEVSVNIKANASSSGEISDVTLVRAGTRDGATTKTPADTLTTSATFHTFGGPTDLWGASWTDTDINDVGFGWDLECHVTFSGTVICSVDCSNITIYYSPASSIGTANGVATATGVGKAKAKGVGTASGIASTSGVGKATAKGTGSAAGLATASGVGIKGGKGTGTANGSASVSGIGACRQRGNGIATGSSEAMGSGSPVTPVGFAAGTADALGEGKAKVKGVGTASASAMVLGIGKSSGTIFPAGKAIGRADGTATTTGIGKRLAVGIGRADGTAFAPGVPASEPNNPVIRTNMPGCCTCGPPCEAHPMLLCVRWTPPCTPANTALTATWDVFDGSGRNIGTITTGKDTTCSSAGGNGGSGPLSITTPITGGRISWVSGPCWVVPPADRTFTITVCNSSQTVDFGTVFLKPNHNCCCSNPISNRCDPTPTTVNVTVCGFSGTATQATNDRFGWTGNIAIPCSTAAFLVPDPINPYGCTVTNGGGIVCIYVGIGQHDLGGACNTMGVSWDTQVSQSVGGAYFARSPINTPCPFNPLHDWPVPLDGPPGCNGVIGQDGMGGVFTLSCIPVFGALSIAGAGIPPGDPRLAGDVFLFAHGNDFYQVFQKIDFTMTFSE